METSVDTLVYQLEDDDTNIRWNTLQKLRRIAAVETSHFPVRNTRRFLQCVRRRIVGEADPIIAIEALRLLGDVMVSLGDNVDQILSSILPHLIPILPRKFNQEQDEDSDEESDTFHEEIFQVFRKYTNATNDLQAVADLLVNIGLGSGHGSVREFSLIVLMRLLDDRFLKRTMTTTRSTIGRGDKALIVALVQAIIPPLEDANEKVVVAAEEAIAKLESYWGSRFSDDVMKFLSSEDKRTLQEHREPIADFLQACTASVSPVTTPPQLSLIVGLDNLPRPTSATSKDMREELRSDAVSFASRSPSKVHPLGLTDELCFSFVKASIVTILTTNTSNSNADWKKRTAAVEKLYAACKEVDPSTLRGLTMEEREKRMDELEGLFDILVRLTQDVDVHLVKRGLQITQILFRKLNPPKQYDEYTTQMENDDNDEGPKDSHPRTKDAAFYMTKMLAPMVETSANFARDDNDMEGFVYALLSQVFESGCVSVNSIEQVLASTSLRHRRSQVREEAVKVWIVLLLIAKREGLLSSNYAPNEFVVLTLGCLLGDTNAYVRYLAIELTAVLTMVCSCNIYGLLETFIADEYVSERVDWAALRSRMRRKHIPEFRSNGTLRTKPTSTSRSVNTSRTNRVALSVEQSLDGFSELKMMVQNESKAIENRDNNDFANEPVRRTNVTAKIGGSLSDRSYFIPEETDSADATGCRETSSEEAPTTIDINDKLSALRKKVDHLRQPRLKRVRCLSSQDGNTCTHSLSERSYGNAIDPTMKMMPRSKSLPDQYQAYDPADDVDIHTQNNDVRPYQSSKDKRVHPNKLALPASNQFTSSRQQPPKHSPQHIQSLQSDACNYEDRPLKSKFIEEQKRVLGADEGSLSPAQEERPIRPMAIPGDPEQIYMNYVDQDISGEFDNNETSSTRKNKGERVISLATRKRLQAKAKQDSISCPTTIPSQDRVSAREINTQNPWKKPANSKGTGLVDEINIKTKASAKQEPRYLELHEITSLINPKQELSKVLTQLQSADWEANFDALNTVRRLATHHADIIDAGMVNAIIVEIMKQVPNLRSAVSKNALLALESTCTAFSRAMDSEVENIVPALLKRCGDSNAFVCDSAATALHAVVLKCSTSRVVSALGAHVNSKATAIRREVARGIHALIVGQVDSIQASKDLPSILQLVGRCLEDSNNEVRDVAKQSVLYLHTKQRISSERIKKFLPASAQTRVDNVLSRKVPYALSCVSDLSEQSSSHSIKKQEMPAVLPRIKKLSKQPSSRTSTPNNGIRSKINADELIRLETKLDSSNWKDRFDALNETTDFVCSCATALVNSGHMLNLFDLLIKRLDDGNAKVSVLALECMIKIVPIIGSGMEQVLPTFVPAITKNLANPRTLALAQSVVQQLCAHADNRSLCQQFAIQARNANSRVIPVLLNTLTDLTAQSFDDKSSHVFTRHVLPLALDLLKEAKSSVKEANSRLLRQLRITLGSAAVSNAASKLSSAQQDKLAAILR